MTFELRFDVHLELLAARYEREGLTREDARARAARQFGNVSWHREEVHLINGSRWLDGLLQDLRFALRQLRHGPGFSAVVIATLALGIGGSTAVFGVMRAVLLAPLPYAQPEQLVRIQQRNMTPEWFTNLRERTLTLSNVAGTRSDNVLTGLDLVKDGEPERLRILLVTSDYFRMFLADPILGPGFSPQDEFGTKRVVLSHPVWQSRFGGDPAVVGSSVMLSGEPYEIAGVAPPGLKDPVAGDVDVWLPHPLRAERNASPSVVIGRVRAGVGVAQVAAEITSLGSSAPRDGLTVVPLHEHVVGPARDFVRILMSAVALVLLAACVNVASLVLVRVTGRAHEFAVRAALGSGRARLASQVIVETLTLAAFGGIVGIAIAAAAVRVLRSFGEHALPRIDAVGVDAAVLLFAVAITLATALACGVIPALRLARGNPQHALTQHSRWATGSRGQRMLRNGLASAQLALALALLAGAVVVSVTFYNLMTVPLGFRVDRVLTFEVNLPDTRYDAPRRARFHEELAGRIAAIPGVSAAGGTSRLPSTGTFHPWPFFIDTGPLAGTRGPQPDPEHRTISGDFFKSLSIPVLAGRTFDARDDEQAPMRAVISANLARMAFPGVPVEHVVGQRVAVLARRNTREIIGVVGDTTTDVHGQPTAAVYSAHRQFASNRPWPLIQVVATDVPIDSILPAVRAAVGAMDPQLVVHRAVAMTDVVGRGTSRERFALILIGSFAAISLLLAAIGLYGVLAYAVRQRTQEIGIRMALGATAREVRALVFRHAAIVLAAGLAAGSVGAVGLGRWLRTIAFQVSPTDLRILVVTALILAGTALIAAWLPARRAARIEPTIAMQSGKTGR